MKDKLKQFIDEIDNNPFVNFMAISGAILVGVVAADKLMDLYTRLGW